MNDLPSLDELQPPPRGVKQTDDRLIELFVRVAHAADPDPMDLFELGRLMERAEWERRQKGGGDYAFAARLGVHARWWLLKRGILRGERTVAEWRRTLARDLPRIATDVLKLDTDDRRRKAFLKARDIPARTEASAYYLARLLDDGHEFEDAVAATENRSDFRP